MSFAETFYSKTFVAFKNEKQKNKDAAVELEIRLKTTPKGVDRDTFTKLYRAVCASNKFSPPVLEKSANFISRTVDGVGAKGIQYIRKLVFGAESTEDSYISKETIDRSPEISGYINYIVGLSVEKKVTKFTSAPDTHVRLKARSSCNSEDGRWRVDFTAVYSGDMNVIGARLGPLKKQFLPEAMTAETFLDTIDYDMTKTLEVEIEFIGDVPNEADIKIISVIYSLVNPNHATESVYQEEIYNVAIKMGVPNAAQFKSQNSRLKRLANQVHAVSKNHYYSEIYPPTGYYLTEKADGVRAVLSIYGGRIRVLRSDGMSEYSTASAAAGTGVAGSNASPTTTIADCEMVGSNYYVFDVMVIEDKNVSGEGFELRHGYLERAAELAAAALGTNGRATAKRFRVLGEKLEDDFRAVYEAKYDYELDGLIITGPRKPYLQTVSYKWKPYEHNTIDFSAMPCPSTLTGKAPFLKRDGRDLYLLFCGINKNDKEILGLGFVSNYGKIFPSTDHNYFPIQFSPSAMPYAYLYWHDPAAGDISGKIVELARDDANSAWIFKRVREDRGMEKNYYGNDFRIAEMTFMNYVDRFNFEDLWRKSESYFQQSGDDIYVAGNKLRRFVVSCCIRDNFAGAAWLLDLASGRGADLHRYQELKVKNALFIEVDTTAVSELVRRKFEFNKTKSIRWGGDDVMIEPPFIKDTAGLTVHTMVADLKSPSSDLIAGTFQYGARPGNVDGIVCNFAIHYMCDTIDNMRNLLLFVSKMLKSGGVFMFSTMDGGKIFNLLRDLPTGSRWESRAGETLKYAIEKRYSGAKLATAGQNIAVKLPFVDEMIEEPLCNVDVVIAECAKLKMQLEIDSCMLEYMDKFTAASPTLASKLSDDDRMYTGLFRVVTVRKA